MFIDCNRGSVFLQQLFSDSQTGYKKNPCAPLGCASGFFIIILSLRFVSIGRTKEILKYFCNVQKMDSVSIPEI